MPRHELASSFLYNLLPPASAGAEWTMYLTPVCYQMDSAVPDYVPSYAGELLSWLRREIAVEQVSRAAGVKPDTWNLICAHRLSRAAADPWWEIPIGALLQLFIRCVCAHGADSAIALAAAEVAKHVVFEALHATKTNSWRLIADEPWNQLPENSDGGVCSKKWTSKSLAVEDLDKTWRMLSSLAIAKGDLTAAYQMYAVAVGCKTRS